ncbi:uncharacterized protein LOC125669177 [Ostrea edulis]|uniref:uncharacterized protein LOC125669177 n=1 Tax=Ostrea edulis TaxID=37623 RepID=UPI0024AEF16F|nr:uncharacterized protein LOC125669177 [Ostrea edulis]
MIHVFFHSGANVSGRWYLYMDTRNTDVRDNTFGDFDVLGNGKLVNNLYRWFPDLEECRTTALSFNPVSSDPETAVKFKVTRMSTKEELGTQTFLYINDHPTEGFVIMHQETQLDTYLITTRQRDPSNLDDEIKAALLELKLDPQNFRVKSTNYGKKRISFK